MQRIRHRKIKTILAGMMISLCWMVVLDAQIIPTDGLIAHYPFNGNANDESGNGNNPIGNIYNPASDRCGSPNSAYSSGKSSYIYLPPSNFIGRNEYTYSLWFRANSIPTRDRWILFSVGSPTEGSEQAFTFNSDQTLAGRSSNIGGNPSLTIINSAPVDTGKWIHSVLTRDNTRLRIFIDGTLAATSILDSLTPGQPANYGSEPIATIGCQWNESSYSFMGAIDDIRIYNRVLNEIEIQQLYFTKCMLSEIFGQSEVCQGQQNVEFYVRHLDNVSSYAWSYTGGTGTTINGNGNSTITIDFANNATDGTLTVTATGDFIDSQTRSMDIQVNILPSDAGNISGVTEICQGNKGVPYSVPEIDNAITYSWSYSDTAGVTINGNTDKVSIDFSSYATGGILTVAGINDCGTGTVSPPFPIAISQLPSSPGTITGESDVCIGQQGITYSIPVIQNATGYAWNYSGTGAVLTGNSNAVAMDFSTQATSGNLTVTGQNNCGEGVRSPEFSIMVSDCSVNPAEITIPNSFSPNGDGVNDVFNIRGLPENSTLIIFNRAGVKLFESTSYANDWDGNDRAGNALASGTYWYVLSVSGETEEHKGFVYLKR